MKPNFALSLSFEGIHLLLRAAEGWRLVDAVSLDSADLVGDLALLEAKARKLGKETVTSKLIIPNDQIKYITLETGDLDEDARDQIARDALDGATPYAVSDLAYAVSSSGSQTYIAAVAHETLAAAEAFAKKHNFNPVSWVSIPEHGNFNGEPFFGQTKAAGDIEVARDDVNIVVSRMIAEVTPVVPPVIVPEPVEIEPVVSELVEPTPMVPEVIEPLLEKVEVADDEADSASDESTEPANADEITSVPPKTDAVSDAENSADNNAALIDPTPSPEPTVSDVIATPGIAATRPKAEKPASISFASRRAPSGPTPVLAGASRESTPTSVTAATVPPIEDTPSETQDLVFVDPPEPQISAGFLSKRKAIPATPPVTTQPSTEAQRLTIFGARKPERKTVVGGKPKFLGLILIAVLLLFLAGVAALASVFLNEGLASFFNAPNDEAITEAPAGFAPAPSEDVGPNIKTASFSADLSSEDTAVLDALRAPQADPVVVLPEFSPQELAANYAVTGIWPVSPEISQPAPLVSLDDLYITSIDPVSSSNDAVALPNVRALVTDNGLGEQTTPVAAGTSFAFGTDGLVIPTVNGAVTPNGVIVFLGRPDVTPPKISTRKALPAKTDPSLALIAKMRPQPRPSNLVEQNERSVNGGLSRSELAQLRPRLRPAVELAITQPAPEVDPTTDNARNDAATLAALAPRVEGIIIEGPPNPQAVIASVRPDGRPKNFARVVKRVKAKQSNDQGTRVASVAPKVVVPKITSPASVAKSATVKNAINLRNVNLIGVYGKPSSRRALVRLSNGRYQKVQVGDRIDGGRVSAIGDNELRYKKGSRNLTLKMPKS
ncbi:MAG: hypothetical protein P8N75_10655 [Ascidiaceihabitans sp.]|nr:hypothetical protein [Ascidiaceihabitans sp.]